MIHGKYNALEYRVYQDEEEIYRAGNSPLESQTYVAAEAGVGLETMARYCGITVHEFSKFRADTQGESVFTASFED